jgi:hypothetical protein
LVGVSGGKVSDKSRRDLSKGAKIWSKRTPCGAKHVWKCSDHF